MRKINAKIYFWVFPHVLTPKKNVNEIEQKSNVEDLVNELCKRLREIENQNSSDFEESVEMEAKTVSEMIPFFSQIPF